MSDEPCATCGGEREITVDHWDPRRDHFTTQEPCPDCAGDDYRELDGEDLDALEKTFWHALQA